MPKYAALDFASKKCDTAFETTEFLNNMEVKVQNNDV